MYSTGLNVDDKFYFVFLQKKNFWNQVTNNMQYYEVSRYYAKWDCYHTVKETEKLCYKNGHRSLKKVKNANCWPLVAKCWNSGTGRDEQSIYRHYQ